MGLLGLCLGAAPLTERCHAMVMCVRLPTSGEEICFEIPLPNIRLTTAAPEDLLTPTPRPIPWMASSVISSEVAQDIQDLSLVATVAARLRPKYSQQIRTVVSVRAVTQTKQ